MAKLAIVYNPLDNKMRDDTYSYIYRGMFDALISEFNPVHITKDCHANTIDADCILFWDVNSCHHIEIKGLANHPSLKMEYMSDPFQGEFVGMYRKYQMPVHKLNAKQRVYRALDRGVSKIIMSNKEGYFKHFEPILKEKADKMLCYFPHAPWFPARKLPLLARHQKVLANGEMAEKGLGYDFRYWAFRRPNITYVKHYNHNHETPMGKNYGDFIKRWAGGLALDDWYPVPKYYEMPMAGCVTFMQYFREVEDLGFKDMESCIFVNKYNFDSRIKDFLNDIPSYQKIADKGRELMENHYTAKHFAKFIGERIESELQNRSSN